MPIAINNPKYSFVQFGETIPTAPCADPAICLPVNSLEDLGFQIRLSAATDIIFPDNPEDPMGYVQHTYGFVICKECGDVEDLPIPDGEHFPLKDYDALSFPLTPDTGVEYLFVSQVSTTPNDTFANLAVGDCFTICLVQFTTIQVELTTYYSYTCLASANCFKKSDETCFTSLLNYKCGEDAFGFIYSRPFGGGTAYFTNKARLPMYLKQPDYRTKEKGYQYSDGTYKKLMERIDKQYKLETSYLTTDLHDRLNVALSHDTVRISNDNANVVSQQFYKSENYVPQWNSNDTSNTKVCKGTTKLILNEPINMINSNCG